MAAVSVASACELNAPDCRLDATRLHWDVIGLQARKFFFSASTRAQIEPATVDRLPLIATEQGVPVSPGTQTLRLAAASSGLGTHSDSVLWLDAGSGAALQYEVLDSGRRQRQRIYRYTDIGAFHRTRYPEKGQTELPPAQWTRVDAGLRPYAPDAVGEVIIDPIALLYIIAASSLERPGDELQMYAFARRRNTRLTLKVRERSAIARRLARSLNDVDMNGCAPPTEALLVTLTTEPMVTGQDADFDFLGLRSDISVWLDPATRLPLQITGKAKIVGRVTVRLRAARCP